MDVQTLFNLGNQFFNEGQTEKAMDMWNRAVSIDRNFREVYINQTNVYRGQGNIVREKESILKFLNSTQTAFSMDLIPPMKQRLMEIEKALNPQLVQPPPVR